MYALILAGGEGKRLSPLTDNKPKCLVEVNGTAIIDYQLRWLISYGFRDIILAIGKKHKQIEDYLGNGSKWNINITYSVEHRALGRGGAIRHGTSKLDLKSQGDLLVLNGDVITNFQINELLDLHFASKAYITTLAKIYQFPHDIISFSNNTAKVQKFTRNPDQPVWTNGGICVMNYKVIPMLPIVGDFEILLLPKLAEKGLLHALRYPGVVHTIDSIYDHIKASTTLLEEPFI